MGILDTLYLNNPYKLNPFHAVIAAFGLAYAPHFLKTIAVKKKNSKQGNKKSFNDMVANSRFEANKATDDSPLGLAIAAYNGCHVNGLEAASYFSAAIIAAVATNVPSEIVQGAASSFVLVRVLYTSVYLTALNGPLRSLVWSVGVWISVDLLFKSADQYAKNL